MNITESPNRKVIQIALGNTRYCKDGYGEVYQELFALCNDGYIFVRENPYHDPEWHEVELPPECA